MSKDSAVEIKYNFIYSKLVTAEDDIVGIIAYGIYKKHKIEFITKIKDEHGREPSDEECRSFFAASTTASQLGNYRHQAEAMLTDVVGNVANEELQRAEYEMLHNYKREISGCIPSNWKSFGFSIAAGIVSSFLFALIAGLFYFMGETSDRSTRDKVRNTMEQVQETNVPPIPDDSVISR